MDSTVLIFVGAIAAFGIFALATVWMGKKRTKAWQEMAGELGIAFVGENNDVMTRCAEMKIFSRGRARRFQNAISGDAGDTKITLGDYRYKTSSGKNSKTRVQTVCVLQSEQLELPHCFLRPEVFLFDAIGGKLGGQDIDFPEDEAFSGSFVLQGDNETAVRSLFDADARQWFREKAGRRFYFEARDNTLVFHTGNRRPPQEAKLLMQQALEIMNVLTKTS